MSLGSFTLSVQESAVTLIDGEIIEFVRKTGSGDEVRTTDTPIFAGAGYADVSVGGRRRLCARTGARQRAGRLLVFIPFCAPFTAPDADP